MCLLNLPSIWKEGEAREISLYFKVMGKIKRHFLHDEEHSQSVFPARDRLVREPQSNAKRQCDFLVFLIDQRKGRTSL
jgi:hypothetical protein